MGAGQKACLSRGGLPRSRASRTASANRHSRSVCQVSGGPARISSAMLRLVLSTPGCSALCKCMIAFNLACRGSMVPPLIIRCFYCHVEMDLYPLAQVSALVGINAGTTRKQRSDCQDAIQAIAVHIVHVTGFKLFHQSILATS